MNSAQLITELRKRLQIPKEDVSSLLDHTVEVITEQLSKNNVVTLHNLGALEVKKRTERLSVHPATGKKMLIPPKLIVGYKVSTTFKDKIKKSSAE